MNPNQRTPPRGENPQCRDCPPPIDNPADQPKDPVKCQPLPPTEVPCWNEPPECEKDPCCKCPPPPKTKPECFDKLYEDNKSQIAAAKLAEESNAYLLELEKSAAAAKLKYTQDKYAELRKRWCEQDAALAELIRKLVCAVPCWRCVIECYVCPILNDMHYAEQRLLGDRSLPAEQNLPSEWKTLYDGQYWWQRMLAAKQRKVDTIRAVLKAWSDPATGLAAALDANEAARKKACDALCNDSYKVVIDVFLRIVPTHLAIAPPVSSGCVTQIEKEFTQFCRCDLGYPDDCCGPDVGEWSLRQRLIGPLPSLVDPNKYFDLICCLALERLKPANEELLRARKKLTEVEETIKQNEALLKPDAFKLVETNAKNAIPKDLDCCDIVPHEGDSHPPRTSRC